MRRTTIDFGIDMGTTNSAIAVLRGTQPVVITDNTGRSFTPSAVWIDKRGHLHVGQEAKERSEEDLENCGTEFKLRMGLGEDGKKVFAGSGREMLPEELSAEVLKSLKADVRVNTGEEIEASVITVPAAFDLPQCDATRRAAELAGLRDSPLLQEPVAAALAYGFQQKADNVFWLVYDFGGGTFDAAVIQVRDGVIQVVNHAGDNYLGGKLIDWDIVEKRLIPALTARFDLTDFRRGNQKWRGAVNKLKMAAEEVKIKVSLTHAPAEIYRDDLCEDNSGQSVDFVYELTPDDLAEIAAPYGERALNLCKKALAEKNLSGSDVEKILMVGGSSLIPSLREQVREELGTPLEFSIDPITVVARGAAVFAGSQRLPDDPGASAPEGSFRIDLKYEPAGSDTEPPVGGRVHDPTGAGLEGYTIEFVEDKTQWRSGRITLGEKGTFVTEIHAEEGRKCEYVIELCDPNGTRQPTTPERFAYTIGMVITCPPLTHSVGVAMANNRFDAFFEKGTPLPARMRKVHRTAYGVRAGEGDNKVRIPIVEGESTARADRNILIGAIELPGDKVRRDLPVGSEVEITLAIDESRIVNAYAYIPVLEQHIEGVLRLKKDLADVPVLREDLDRQKRRLSELVQESATAGDATADAVLQRIRNEEMVEQAESLLQAAESDRDAVQGCEQRLLALKGALDEIEDALEKPVLMKEAQEHLEYTRDKVRQYGTVEDQAALRALEPELQRAVESGDTDVLRQSSDEVWSLGSEIAFRRPEFWVGYFAYLEQEKPKMRDALQAEALLDQGRRVRDAGDVEALKAAVRQLVSLLPVEEQEKARGYGGTTIWTV